MKLRKLRDWSELAPGSIYIYGSGKSFNFVIAINDETRIVQENNYIIGLDGKLYNNKDQMKLVWIVDDET